jgi:hypothetical protein
VDGGLTSRDAELSEKIKAILINNILQTEAGGSLSDITVNTATPGSTSGNERITALLAEAPDLFNEIARLLTTEDENGMLSYGGSFEVSYAYKNGTLIDKDLAGKGELERRADQAFRWMALELRNQSGSTVVDFDKFGNPVNGKTFRIDLSVLVPSFVEDALRLHQFENGDAESGEHLLRVTFSKGGVVEYQVIAPEAEEIDSQTPKVIATQEQMHLAIEDFHLKELQRQIEAVTSGASFTPSSKYSFREDVYNKSKHFDTLGWALGLQMNNSWDDRWNPSWNGDYFINGLPAPKWSAMSAAVSRSVQSKNNVLTLRANNQANWEKIDKKITDVLKSNGIVLGEKEKLTFKVNQRGEITVGDGVNGSKREKIEKLLNKDKTLAKDLLFAHAERRWAVNSAGEGYDGRANIERYILTDAVLRREYGVSLNDIQMSGGDHAGLLEKLYNEERMFYNDIENALKSLEENGGDFEVRFAYKNGITIEPGVTDQSAMDITGGRLFSSWSWNPAWGVETSVTLDPTGSVLNAQVTGLGRLSSVYAPIDQTSILNHLNKELTTHLAWSSDCNSAFTPSQSRLQQFAFDAQRLFQFNTGFNVAAANATVTFGTGGTSTSNGVSFLMSDLVKPDLEFWGEVTQVWELRGGVTHEKTVGSWNKMSDHIGIR